MSTITLRFKDVEDEPLSPIQLSNISSYYNTYNGGVNNSIIFIPFDLYTPMPTGSLNFSIMDKFEIKQNGIFYKYLYAVRYNLLRFRNGAASLQYI